LVCLAAWLWFMGIWGQRIYRIREQLNHEPAAEFTWIADACFAGWLAFISEGFFEFNFGTTPVLMVFLLLMSLPFTLEGLSLKTQGSRPATPQQESGGGGSAGREHRKFAPGC
jgi:hypothetical protein